MDVDDTRGAAVLPLDAPLAPPSAGAPAVVASPARARARAHAPLLLLVVVALASSVTSLGNGFTYDDRWIIQFNTRVHDLSRAWSIFGESYWPVLSNGLYRPLVSLGFALQWVAGGGRPAPFHAASVLLYVACVIAVWRLARLALPAWAAWAAAAVFAVHPVHVEAVGNIVGQAELGCALLTVIAVTLWVRWRREGRVGVEAARPEWGRVGIIVALGAAATLFKEQGILLPALLVLADATLVDDTRGWRARGASLRPMLLVTALVTLLLLVARVRVLGAIGGDIPHPSFEGIGTAQRTVGMLGLVPVLARVLLWPSRLSADYGPSHVQFITTWHAAAVAGLLVALGVVALAVAAVRRMPAVTFGIAWMLVTWAPVSNVLMPSGILLAERTLFAPSVGLVIALAGLAVWLADAARASQPVPESRLTALGAVVLLIVVAAGAMRSAGRQRVWSSNEALFSQMVEEAPMSARAHYALGGHYFERRQAADAEREWRIAIALDSNAWRIKQDLAERYKQGNLCAPAEPLYREVLARVPHSTTARLGLVVCLRRGGRLAEAERVARLGFGTTASPAFVRKILVYARARTEAQAAAALAGFRAAGPGATAGAMPQSARTSAKSGTAGVSAPRDPRP